MISPNALEGAPITPIAAEIFAVGAEAQRVSLMLDFAEYCGWQEDGKGGGFQLWTLRKAIPGHPKGSTIDRGTLEKYLFGDYGKTSVSATSLPAMPENK